MSIPTFELVTGKYPFRNQISTSQNNILYKNTNSKNTFYVNQYPIQFNQYNTGDMSSSYPPFNQSNTESHVNHATITCPVGALATSGYFTSKNR